MKLFKRKTPQELEREREDAERKSQLEAITSKKERNDYLVRRGCGFFKPLVRLSYEGLNDYLAGNTERYSGSRVGLYLPELCLLDFEEAERIIKNMCEYPRNGWKFEHALGRGTLTGSGFGNLEIACASDEKKNIVGMVSMYQRTGGKGCEANQTSVFSDFPAGVEQVYPRFSSIAEIQSPELRNFIGLFYDGLYRIRPKER